MQAAAVNEDKKRPQPNIPRKLRHETVSILYDWSMILYTYIHTMI